MADPAWSNVKLHVTADASPVVDLGPVGYALTFNGNAARSTAQAKFGAASIAFDGTNDSVETATSFDFDLAASAWTMRLHFRLNAVGATDQTIFIVHLDSNNWIEVLYQLSTGKLLFVARGGGFSRISSVGTGPSISTGQWYHLAMSHSGTTTRGFIDGAQVVSNVTAINYDSGAYYVRLGENRLNGQDFNGWIDEIQFCRETLYTGGFTAPTQAYPYNIAAVATGLQSGSFGTPTNRLTQAATGFLGGTTFGTPYAVFPQIGEASGFLSGGSFGTPDLLDKFLDASGFQAINFGAAVATQRFRASALGPVTRFGTPTTVTDRTCVAEGFSTTRLSPDAVALVYDPPVLDRTVVARWLDARPQWGLPEATTSFTGQTSGSMGTSFGEPDSLQSFRGDAAAIEPGTMFGTPGLALRQRATGSRDTQFGTPKAEMVLAASSIGELTRWGLPQQWGPHRSTGRMHTRMGHPTALQRFNYPAEGWAATQFGTPAAVQTHKASMIPPGTQFGTPLLVRSPSC